MPEKPYEDGECQHLHTLNVRGRWTCRQCGRVYNETTFEWEEKRDDES